ncbi:hypothetical protein ACVI1J_008835 [Bradyrhizobium diazoefficiens]
MSVIAVSLGRAWRLRISSLRNPADHFGNVLHLREHVIRRKRPQRRWGRIAPADRAAGDADRARRLDVAHLVADRDDTVELHAGAPDDAAEFRGLAEYRRRAIEMREQRRGLAELLAGIGFAVGSHQRELHAVLGQRLQHRLDAGKQRDLASCLGLQPPRMPRDRRQLPQRHLEPAEDLARRGMPQPLDVLIGDTPKAEAVGDVVDGAQEPGEAVGEGAVEVEDGEGVGHGGVEVSGGPAHPVRWRRADRCHRRC